MYRSQTMPHRSVKAAFKMQKESVRYQMNSPVAVGQNQELA